MLQIWERGVVVGGQIQSHITVLKIWEGGVGVRGQIQSHVAMLKIGVGGGVERAEPDPCSYAETSGVSGEESNPM